MRLQPACPACGSVVTPHGGAWTCPVHGARAPLWRRAEASYEAFAEHLTGARGLPTWMPWPLPPGWGVADFGCVRDDDGPPRATFVTCEGLTPTDGGVALTVVTEEPGVGLGAHLAGVPHSDPGITAWDQPAALRVRVDGVSVPLWSVAVQADEADGPTRTVLAGEAQGRWLWFVVTPAEAVLGLADRSSLVDVSQVGPELVTVPFGQSAG